MPTQEELDNSRVFRELPLPPAGSEFQLQKVEKISIPHPFCIGPRHVAYAADHCGGMLTPEAIDQSGVGCCMEIRDGSWRGRRLCGEPYDAHETMLTVFIAVPRDKQRDLNSVPGLHDYLLACKARSEAAGLSVNGFAFPALPEVTIRDGQEKETDAQSDSAKAETDSPGEARDVEPT